MVGGPHHCIGTGHSIVDTVFRYLQIKCASHGGTLTDTELVEAQMEFVDDFQFMFDQFENVHAKCMDASGATATMMFSKGRMLSWLLSSCSRHSAADVFSGEVQDLRGNWLKAFYVVLSDFVRQYVSMDAEARLTSAYVKASMKYGQSLTINNYLQEQAVQNVLRECLRGIEMPGFADELVAFLKEKLDNMNKDFGIGVRNLDGVTIRQIRDFVDRAPDEVRVTLAGLAAVA